MCGKVLIQTILEMGGWIEGNGFKKYLEDKGIHTGDRLAMKKQ